MLTTALSLERVTPLFLKPQRRKQTEMRHTERLKLVFSSYVLDTQPEGENSIFLHIATDLRFNSSLISSAFGAELSISIMSQALSQGEQNQTQNQHQNTRQTQGDDESRSLSRRVPRDTEPEAAQPDRMDKLKLI